MSTIITSGLPGSQMQLMTMLGSGGSSPVGSASTAGIYQFRYRYGASWLGALILLLLLH